MFGNYFWIGGHWSQWKWDSIFHSFSRAHAKFYNKKLCWSQCKFGSSCCSSKCSHCKSLQKSSKLNQCIYILLRLCLSDTPLNPLSPLSCGFPILSDTPSPARVAGWGSDTPLFARVACHRKSGRRSVSTCVSGKGENRNRLRHSVLLPRHWNGQNSSKNAREHSRTFENRKWRKRVW